MRRQDDLPRIGADHQRRNVGRVALDREDLRMWTAAHADVGNLDAAGTQARVRFGNLRHAPGQAPQPIRPVAYAGLEVVCHLEDAIAAAQEEQADAPLRLRAIETQAEAQTS